MGRNKTEEKAAEQVIKWRHQVLDRRDCDLDRLEAYLLEHPEALPQKGGELTLSSRLLDRGQAVEVTVVSYGSKNAALTITPDCMNPDAEPQPAFLEWTGEGEEYHAHLTYVCDIPGNTRFELWVNGERLVRQAAVLDRGYMAVIPWVGSNKPYLDETLHRYDIPGDYWGPGVESDPEETIARCRKYMENHRKYGDRIACFVNARTLVPGSETDSLFELDGESQERGIKQIARQMQLLGLGEMELLASYTPDAVTMDILEKMGVKGLTSLCAWQNWQDHGWKINHCGVSNQPYYPADDDFRRAGKKRNLMCFTMGNASCNRNYSIMVYDGCPTNVVPGERYLAHYVENQGIQRFYDTFDGYVADAANNSSLMTVTIALESFKNRMDWNAANEMAVRYMVKKAASEKIVFTSAADVSDYHKRKNLGMQEALFFQPDYYYGYHNGTLPGHVDDRIEADTEEYLAVIRRSSMLPMYFYDYTEPWNNVQFEDTIRNEFGLVDPDTHKPSECTPEQVYTEDVLMESRLEQDILTISVETPTRKKKLVTGIFDLPYEKDFEIVTDKKDVRMRKVTDHWTGNIHLFCDLGEFEPGRTVITSRITGTARTAVQAECRKDELAAKWFGKHAYLRSIQKELAIHVVMEAPKGAYLHLISGEKVPSEKGMLEFTVNRDWADEAPILYGYPRKQFESALKDAKVDVIGPTTCSRWSGQ